MEQGRRSEETLPTGRPRAIQDDERVADKAGIALVNVQPRQLVVADA